MTNTIKQPTIEESIKHFTEVTGRPAPLPPSSHGMGLSEMRKTPIAELIDFDDAPWIVKIFLNYVRLQREETEHTATLFKVFGGKKYIISKAFKTPWPKSPHAHGLAVDLDLSAAREAISKPTGNRPNIVLGIAGSTVKAGEWVQINAEGKIVPVFHAEKKRAKKKAKRRNPFDHGLSNGYQPRKPRQKLVPPKGASGVPPLTKKIVLMSEKDMRNFQLDRDSFIAKTRAAYAAKLKNAKKKKVKRLHHGQE